MKRWQIEVAHEIDRDHGRFESIKFLRRQLREHPRIQVDLEFQRARNLYNLFIQPEEEKRTLRTRPGGTPEDKRRTGR